MIIFRYICLIVFAIIIVLFTIGYSSQPIITTASALISPNGSLTSITDITYFTTYFTTIIDNTENSYNKVINNKYGNLFDDIKLIFIIVFYLCVFTTVLLAIGIFIVYFKLTLISKIIFVLAFILMLIAFLILQLFIIFNSILVMGYTQSINSPSTSNGNGYYLMLSSLIIMFINCILYCVLA
jgi:hypothetical protein